MRIAIATFAGIGEEWTGDAEVAERLAALGAEASLVPWDGDVDWSGFDLVVVRSTWDYTHRLEEFLAWADRVGDRLHNRPSLIRWNSDKRYLADLAAVGLPTVPTAYVAPGEVVPPLDGEIVVKPSVSAGAKDTGRFGPGAHDAACTLIGRIHASGRTAMVQRYVESVDAAGETAVVCIDGQPAYALHKRAVLAADEVAPVRDDALGAAEAMYDAGLVRASTATDAELELAGRVVAEVTGRFGDVPLYARVDVVPGPDGSPILMELEAIEPSLYHDQVPGSADRLAEAIVRRASPGLRPNLERPSS